MCGEVDLGRRLFRVFRLRRKRDVDFHFDKFYAKLLHLVKVWRCSTKLKAKLTRSWLADWCVRYGVIDKNERERAANEVSSMQPDNCTLRTKRTNLEHSLDEYSANEVYLFFCFHF